MNIRPLKQGLLKLAKRLPLRFLPLDPMLRVSQRIGAYLGTLIFLRDWSLEARGRPQFFKHQINLSRWLKEPARWSFCARGVYAREHMFKGCRVLDLCCGDGTFSYLFFSDIAAHIDAVDLDTYAIEYAKKHYSAPPITYRRMDIVKEDFPGSAYDVVVWNAAICYFQRDEIRQILRKIVLAGSSGLVLDGMLPRANGWIDHKTEFATAQEVEDLLGEFFEKVAIREVNEGSSVTYYFNAAKPWALSPTSDRAMKSFMRNTNESH